MTIKITGTNTAAAPGITGTDTDTGLVYGTDTVSISTGGTARTTVNSSGHLLPGAADTYDLGANTTPWRNIWMENDLYIEDNGMAVFGTGEDLKIYHDGSDTRIVNNTGDFQLQSDTLLLKNKAGDETYFKAVNNGSAELYYNNARKLSTEGDGLNVETGSSSVHLKMQCNSAVSGYFYADSDPQIGILSNSGSWIFRVLPNGNYQHYGTSISDRDRKDNITTVTGTSLDKITKLVPKTYTWKPTADGKTPTDKTFTGFIAQEVKEHLPSLVTGTDGLKDMAVDYNGILAHAVKAITELSAEVDTLKTEKTKLQTDLTALTARVAALEAHTHE